MNRLPVCKTRIVCTIGPASWRREVLASLLGAGMTVARLNFSHGDFDLHAEVIDRIRDVSVDMGLPLAIMADLPGPKMRIGDLASEPVHLEAGAEFVLTTRDVVGDGSQVSITMKELPGAVKPGQTLFLNDGQIELQVVEASEKDIRCLVVVGGELRSRKGINVPGLDLGISAFTPRDHECMAFALDKGVDAVSQSFVGSADDIYRLRKAARSLGHDPFVIAKIERSSLVERLDSIIEASDGIMVARGDLGVEIPIERIALAQKFVTRKAVVRGKPVITATQMLLSMTSSRRPTRAEATDVANAILDGTDAVMLSEESAMGRYPVEAAAMLTRIAAATEPHLPRQTYREWNLAHGHGGDARAERLETIARSVDQMAEGLPVAAVFCPTESGETARRITRYRLPCWIVALSARRPTCRRLMFSHGIHPVECARKPESWVARVRELSRDLGLPGEVALVTEGPSSVRPDQPHRIEMVELSR